MNRIHYPVSIVTFLVFHYGMFGIAAVAGMEQEPSLLYRFLPMTYFLLGVAGLLLYYRWWKEGLYPKAWGLLHGLVLGFISMYPNSMTRAYEQIYEEQSGYTASGAYVTLPMDLETLNFWDYLYILSPYLLLLIAVAVFRKAGQEQLSVLLLVSLVYLLSYPPIDAALGLMPGQ